MLTFICAILVLIAGYFIYGRIIERVFAPDERPTPASAHPDGADYVPMKTWRVFLVQLLNIAGTGPIFGALLGAVFGPVVFLWIVLGSIFAGAVHDYMTGMISVRMDGASVSEIVGKYLGPFMKQLMRVFSVVLLILVGTVFTTTPAALIARLTPDWMNVTFWTVVILVYYLLATVLPIDKLIGRIYPAFGVVLIIMAVGIVVGLVAGGYKLPELRLENMHPAGKSVWPFMFITVACGAISGFHATQSPMMARCITSEKDGRRVFYGAMLTESVIALVWAAAGVAFYGATGGLQNALSALTTSGVVYDISFETMDALGGVLAVIGVVICPISSGDTAFRSARLTIADAFRIEQKSPLRRILVTLPLLIIGAVLTTVNFDIIWRYFSWSNQTLAMIALWAAAAYLSRETGNRNKGFFCAIPAAFMSAVSLTYILMADEGFRISAEIAYPAGIVFAAACLALWLRRVYCKAGKERL